jgi:hypothetical protein
MKKIIFFCVLLLCVILVGCTDVKPDIVSVEYIGGKFVITLAGFNRNDEQTVKSLMTITEDGFTGTEIGFSFESFTDNVKTYTLIGFSPPLVNGKIYYFSFEEGAFGNYGIPGFTDKSSPGVYFVPVS